MTQTLLKLKRKLLIISMVIYYNMYFYYMTIYITTPEFNKLIAENLAARLAQANLVTDKF